MKSATQEDENHLLEEIWDADPEEPLCKIIKKETAKGIHKLLVCSREALAGLSCREDEGSISTFVMHKVGDICMTVEYQSSLIAKDLFPEDTNSFRLNSIKR